MQVALVANTAWLEEELPLLRLLVPALAAEGVRAVPVVPERFITGELQAWGPCVAWQDSAWAVVRQHRLAALAKTLNDLDTDVVQALDGRAWHGALKLATRLNVPAVLGAGSAADIALLERLIGPIREVPVPVAFTATTEPLAAAVRRIVGAESVVETIRPGVQAAPEPPPPAPAPGNAPGSGGSVPASAGDSAAGPREASAGAEPAPPVPPVPPAPPGDAAQAPLCAALCGSGVLDADSQTVFQAIGAIIAEFPQAQFFLDGIGHDLHPLWQMARRYELLTNLSMVPRRLDHRELLLKADLLIHPQVLGRSRSLTLQAMAHGLPIVCRQDPWLDYLVDGVTAWVVDLPIEERWIELIRRAILHPDEARRLGRSARQWVRPRHAIDQQVAALLELYRRLAGVSFKFPAAGAGR